MEPTNQPQEEIRFIELLATVIRYRRWIYGFTGLGVVVAVVFVWLLPLIGITLLNPAAYSVQTTLRAASVPETIRSYVADDLPSLALAQVADLGLVGQIYKATLATDKVKSLGRPEYNRIIKGFIKGNLKATVDSSKVLISYSLKTGEGQQEQALAFLTQFVAAVEASQRAALLPSIQSGLATIAGSLSKSADLSGGTLAITKSALTSLVNDPGFPFSTVGSVELVEDDPVLSTGILTTLLILAGLITGLIVAFINDTIARTRKNPEDMKLLHNAWSRSRER